MQFLVLGPLEVHTGAEAVSIRTGRPRTLLHLLLLQRRVALPVELIADRLWGEQVPVDGPNAVHQLVSYLRRSLGPESRGLITTTPSGYRLDVADDDVDAFRFEKLVHSASSAIAGGTHAGATAGLEEADAALRLWRGDPFTESVGEDWASADITRLRDAYQLAQESRLEALLVLGRHREVVLEAQSLAAAYPLREHFHGLRARALYRSGRQSDALEVLRDVRSLLAEELGIDPGTELQHLEEQILRQDPALEWSVPPDRPALSNSGWPANNIEHRRTPASRGPEPHQLTSPGELFGRDHDLLTTRAHLVPGRFLTLTGPGGVGKTHMALTLVTSALDSGAWFVDLGDVEQDGFVAATVAERLGVTGPSPSDAGDRVLESMTACTGLLVLDACEHVRRGVADLIGALRGVAPELTILATSRRPLGVSGESVHQLPPLAVPEAGESRAAVLASSPSVQLFRDRARVVQAGFELNDQNASDIAAIVTGLDGLPLAIELAAAQVDVLSPAHIRTRLADQLAALVSSDPAAPGRQRSLRGVIESSVVLLSDAEQAFLWPLGVFPGCFDIHAAIEVSACAESDAYALLASLVRQSLVARDGESHYRLLAPIRAFARDRMRETSVHATTRKRHADWIADAATRTAESTRGVDQEKALVMLRGLLPDARSALAWSIEQRYIAGAARVGIAFSWLWTLHGLADEGIGWLSKVRTLCASDPEHRHHDAQLGAAVLRSLGLLANPVGELALAREVCTEGVALSREAGDDAGAAAALLTLGVAHWAMGELKAAATAHEEAAELASQQPESWSFLAATVLRARTALDAGESDALSRIHTAVALAQRANERQLLGLALSCQARFLHHHGDTDRAIVVATEALRVWRQIDYREGEMSALNILSRSHARQGEYDEAAVLCGQALALAMTARHPGAMCESIESMAALAAEAGRREHAYLLLSSCARERRRVRAVVPPADQATLDVIEASLRESLGAAVGLVEEQAAVLRFDDLVEQLVSQPPSA